MCPRSAIIRTGAMPGFNAYFFFLWRFLRKRFLRLWVDILCRFLFLPQGMVCLVFVLVLNVGDVPVCPIDKGGVGHQCLVCLEYLDGAIGAVQGSVGLA